MSDNKMDTLVSPAYLIRSYAWKLLETNYPEVWTESNYGGKVPIVPVAEEPELDEYSGPHIVYGFAIDATGRLNARNSGSVTFAIYDDNFRRLTKTLNILQAAFEREDETARDVNNYTTSVTGGTPGAQPFLGIRFGTISLGFIEGGTPEETEGGRQSALINISFDYYVEYDVITQLTE